MEYRRLGKSGLRLSAVSFGSWVTFGNQVGDAPATELMTLAYDSGINFFDNAEVYADGESERIMGRVLKKSGWGRDTYCVSSKVFWGGEKPTQMGLSRKHIVDACHAALERLQVSYLDLYFCHRPDIHTPIEEVVWSMHTLVMQGKILYWGTSEWSALQIAEAYRIAQAHHLVPPTMEQPEYNLFNRKKVDGEFKPLFRDYGLGTTIWSPLASGFLTGKYNRGIPEGSRVTVPGYEWLKANLESPRGQDKLEKTKRLSQIASDLGISTAQLAIAWCLKNPNVSTVILGATKPEQLRENLAALGHQTKLTPEVLAQIEAIVANRPEDPQDFAEL
jgi:voltage-dependent potassium channel beta subunit